MKDNPVLSAIIAVITVLGAWIYSTYLSPLANIPFNDAEFIELLVWIVTGLLTGWNTKVIQNKYKSLS